MKAPDEVFPLRVGAIDVGSNAIRFVAAEFLGPSQWLELEYQRVPVRLGHEGFLTGSLDEAAMNQAVDTLTVFRSSMDHLGLARYRAVATSAVRESANGSSLIQRVRRESGIQLEAITGSEEARLVWLAARSRLQMEGPPWLLVDLGGGSMEVSLVSREGILRSYSHTIGTVRLLEVLQDDAESDFRKLVADYAATLRIGDLAGIELAGLAATGGNIEDLAHLAGREADEGGVSRISLADLRAWIPKLSGMSVRERVEQLGLREDRADVILPAALLYERVASLAGVAEIVVPNVGVKEGVLLDLVEDMMGPSVHASRVEQQALDGALALGRRFQFDESHARHVARLALSLFDQLGDLHRLGRDERRVLLGAAVLHDIGQFVSFRKHHKHSLYLIHNSDVPNFSPDEIPLVALVARYHRGAEPRDEHFLFDQLSKELREDVTALAAILRVADALDREHLQRVSTVKAEVTDDVLLLEVQGEGDLLLERWALRKKGRMFDSVFGLEVRMVKRQPADVPGVV